MRSLAERSGDGGIPKNGGFEAVMEDLIALMTDSQDFFPADFEPPVGPHYGGLFVRLAWHCAGSYRATDGRGGCDGGRIRFDPEMSWPDNANLDMAIRLLQPIKRKYGSSLSWGDLIILSGNAAIVSMGGPVLGFCGGRIDDADGSASLTLGPSEEQEAIAPCQSLTPSQQGTCLNVENSALGPTTVGLIYVNPAGPVGAEGDPQASAGDIRRAFSNMDFDDQISVALIGGAHTFGKCHGACPDPPCGEGALRGIGPNTFTSGFEGAWTTQPTTWSNEYFTNLFEYQWNTIIGPGGQLQWAPSPMEGDKEQPPDIIMLTTDIAFTVDPKYRRLALLYAANQTKLDEDFASAWYQLTTGDMGPVTRCIGNDVPPAQPFQSPLPSGGRSGRRTNFVPVRAAIQRLLNEDRTGRKRTALINLAFRCASTFRATDFRGGCNGARIRFPPESEWPINAGTSDALAYLRPIKRKYSAVSYADLIVLAGQTAIEDANKEVELRFCGGRVDAMDAANSRLLAPRVYDPPVVSVRDNFQVTGLTAEQGVALAAFETVSNQFFIDLLANPSASRFSDDDRALLQAEFRVHVETFASNPAAFHAAFVSGWEYLMTADRFDGPFNNLCTGVSDRTVGRRRKTGGKKKCKKIGKLTVCKKRRTNKRGNRNGNGNGKNNKKRGNRNGKRGNGKKVLGATKIGYGY